MLPKGTRIVCNTDSGDGVIAAEVVTAVLVAAETVVVIVTADIGSG